MVAHSLLTFGMRVYFSIFEEYRESGEDHEHGMIMAMGIGMTMVMVMTMTAPCFTFSLITSKYF